MANLKQMWQAGASYEELHRVESPHSKCECDYCEMMRGLDDWDDWAYRQGEWVKIAEPSEFAFLKAQKNAIGAKERMIHIAGALKQIDQLNWIQRLREFNRETDPPRIEIDTLNAIIVRFTGKPGATK